MAGSGRKRWGRVVLAAGVLAAALAAAGLAYRLMWLGVVTVEPLAPRVTCATPASLRVAIVHSEATARFLGSGAVYDAHAGHWQKLARSLGAKAELIGDAGLEAGLDAYGVVVLPSVVCIGEQGRAGIRAFLAAGGGVIVTWATGTRDENAEWQGWDFLRELTGADSFQSRDAEAPWFVGFRARNPLAAGPPAGLRVQVASPDRLEATALDVDAYWSDARLFPRSAALSPSVQGALLHRERSGRVAWLGFHENAATGDAAKLLETVLANSLAWVGRATRVEVEPWPAPHGSAVLLALDVDQSAENASYAAEALLRAGAPGTFFYPSERVDDLRDTPSIARAGELALQGRPFGAAQGFDRLSGLATARYRLWRSGVTVFGLAHADVDRDGLLAFGGTGFHYYFVDGAEGSSVRPAAVTLTQSWGPLRRELALVRLARTTDDDLHLSPLGLFGLEPEWVTRRILADFDTVRGLGGLYVLSYHSQGLSSPEYAPVLSRLVEEWRRNGAWVASAGEIAGWWTARGGLSVAVSPAGDPPRTGGKPPRTGALRVEVSSATRVPSGLVLSLYPSVAFSGAHLEPRGSAAQVVAEPASGSVRLVLGPLEPGANLRLEVRLEP